MTHTKSASKISFTMFKILPDLKCYRIPYLVTPITRMISTITPIIPMIFHHLSTSEDRRK